MPSKGRSNNKTRTFVIASFAIVALVAGYLLGNQYAHRSLPLQTATLIKPPRDLQPFQLVDQDGQPLGIEQLKGQWDLLFFGYTHCPDICPVALTTMAAIHKGMDDAPELQKQVQVRFVSVDPFRDTPEHLKGFVTFFHPSFKGATGDEKQIQALTQQLGVFYEIHPPDEQGDYLIDHSGSIIIIDPDGRYHGVISGAHFDKPEVIAGELKQIIRDF